MLFLYALLSFMPLDEIPDSLNYDLSAVTVTAPTIKHNGDFHEQPVSVSTFSHIFLETNRITETKDLSFSVPNFIQADYGSKMTSSIYVRGIGSRMDQPSVGFYLDNIPILNKNNYDIDYFDVRNIHFLRGPQGTLYGRNTIAGIIDLHTLSPLMYQGTHIHAGYGNGNTSEIRFSTYHKPTENYGFSIALSHKYSDGFFTNAYDGTSADRILSEGLRWKNIFQLSPSWSLENTLFMSYVDQKGFAYARYDEESGRVSEINHNDPHAYERFSLINGTTFRYQGKNILFSSTTSYQYTDDDMVMDQDYLPVSMFTLEQDQKEHGFTQEFVLRSNTDKAWQWVTGAFGFYKRFKMEAPVVFKQDGINSLILDHANGYIHMMFPHANLLIEESSFPIESSFRHPVYGASLYHQSSYGVGRWKFTGGIRMDYEHTSIRYSGSTSVRYRFDMTMPDFKSLPVDMAGKKSKSYFEFMPLASVVYRVPCGTLYTTFSRGYKAGGYNTQIFSDITKNRLTSALMTDLMESLGRPGSGTADDDPFEAISYDPEYSWNYEFGAHLNFPEQRLNLDASFFYIDIRDQQLTVFPSDQGTGRLMSNAGRSRSYGAEASLSYRQFNWLFTANYGYTHAKFKDYDRLDADYSGRYVPYIPRHTVSALCEYRLPVRGSWADHILFNLNWTGAGRLFWNESNTISQSFYGQLNGSVQWKRGKYALGIWGKNLTDNDYNTFYFESLGNSFVQRGKPVQFGGYIKIDL